MIEIKVINNSENKLPAYETEHSAGVDLRASFEAPEVVKPFQRVMVPTGLYIALPEGTEAQVRPRSGLAWKKGLTVLNSPGTIDADYRGELRIILINLSEEPVTIEPGDRIAQLVIAPYLRARFQEVSQLEPTQRGSSGFGSTGEK